MKKLNEKPNYVPQKGCMTVTTYRKHMKFLVGLLKELLEVGEFDTMTEEELVDALVDEFVDASDSLYS